MKNLIEKIMNHSTYKEWQSTLIKIVMTMTIVILNIKARGVLYYGMITTSKPYKSDKGILIRHVQYDDDSEHFNKEEAMETIDLYKSRLLLNTN